MFSFLCTPTESTSVSAQMRPTSRLMQAVDVVKRFMDQFSYALHDGCMYRKPKEAKYTFVYCSSVHDFIHSILGNAEVAEVIASHTSTLISLLSVPACRLIQPIDMDYNFIEVRPLGTLFDIEGKCFVSDGSKLKGDYSCFTQFSFVHVVLFSFYGMSV